MIIVMKLGTPSVEIERVIEEIRRHEITPEICQLYTLMYRR